MGIGHTIFPGKFCLIVVRFHIDIGTSCNQQNKVMIFLKPDMFTATLCDLMNQPVIYILEYTMTPSQFSFCRKMTVQNMFNLCIIIT